jgi:hypothetical protein
MRVRRVVMVLLASVSLSGQEPLGPAQNGVNYVLEKEAALGKQLAADFRRRTIPISSPSFKPTSIVSVRRSRHL